MDYLQKICNYVSDRAKGAYNFVSEHRRALGTTVATGAITLLPGCAGTETKPDLQAKVVYISGRMAEIEKDGSLTPNEIKILKEIRKEAEKLKAIKDKDPLADKAKEEAAKYEEAAKQLIEKYALEGKFNLFYAFAVKRPTKDGDKAYWFGLRNPAKIEGNLTEIASNLGISLEKVVQRIENAENFTEETETDWSQEKFNKMNSRLHKRGLFVPADKAQTMFKYFPKEKMPDGTDKQVLTSGTRTITDEEYQDLDVIGGFVFIMPGDDTKVQIGMPAEPEKAEPAKEPTEEEKTEPDK